MIEKNPLKNDGVRQLEWWNSQLNGKIRFMSRTTNQEVFKHWNFNGFIFPETVVGDTTKKPRLFSTLGASEFFKLCSQGYEELKLLKPWMGIYNDLIDFKQILTSLSLFRMAADQWLISCAKIAAETSRESAMWSRILPCAKNRSPVGSQRSVSGFHLFDPCYHDRNLYSNYVVCVYI